MTLTNETIEQWLRDYMSDPAQNTMKELHGPAFDLPSAGFSRADDPLYAFYQQHIDPAFYRRPEQWLESVYGHPFDAANVSVISWVLPQTADTRAKSRASTDCPTMEWQMVRVHGEECNRNMAKALEQHLTALGYEAVDTAHLDTTSYRLIFNTAPVMLLPQCPGKGLKIDLASKLGLGGLDVVWARQLPGRYAPKSSGNLIAETVLKFVNKEDAP